MFYFEIVISLVGILKLKTLLSCLFFCLSVYVSILTMLTKPPQKKKNSNWFKLQIIMFLHLFLQICIPVRDAWEIKSKITLYFWVPQYSDTYILVMEKLQMDMFFSWRRFHHVFTRFVHEFLVYVGLLNSFFLLLYHAYYTGEKPKIKKNSIGLIQNTIIAWIKLRF